MIILRKVWDLSTESIRSMIVYDTWILKLWDHFAEKYDHNFTPQWSYRYVFWRKIKIFEVVYFKIRDRIFSTNDRILFANDRTANNRILSVKIVYFQPELYPFSHDRILKQDRLLFMIVYFPSPLLCKIVFSWIFQIRIL